MKILILSLIFLAQSIIGHSQEEKSKSLYSGGMMILQPGLTITANDNQAIRNNSTAIGGILRFYISELYTVGIYGGSQQTNYTTPGSENSYLHLGYGGVFAGLSYKYGKWRYTGSVFTGMGSFRNLHIENQEDTKLTDASLYQESTLLYSPILSIDYAITRRIYLSVQTVCLMGKLKERNFYNPTVQIGILFSR